MKIKRQRKAKLTGISRAEKDKNTTTRGDYNPGPEDE
jgi:hypothetical protein